MRKLQRSRVSRCNVPYSDIELLPRSPILPQSRGTSNPIHPSQHAIYATLQYSGGIIHFLNLIQTNPKSGTLPTRLLLPKFINVPSGTSPPIESPTNSSILPSSRVTPINDRNSDVNQRSQNDHILRQAFIDVILHTLYIVSQQFKSSSYYSRRKFDSISENDSSRLRSPSECYRNIICTGNAKFLQPGSNFLQPFSPCALRSLPQKLCPTLKRCRLPR